MMGPLWEKYHGNFIGRDAELRADCQEQLRRIKFDFSITQDERLHLTIDLLDTLWDFDVLNDNRFFK